MSHERLISRVVGTPLLLARHKLDIMAKNVIVPLILNERGVIQENLQYLPAERQKVSEKDVAIINVFDSLVSKGGIGTSGYTSYQGISDQIDSLVSLGYKTIGFYHDSPGGEVSGNFGLSNKIRNLGNLGIRTFSFTDGMMTSGSYSLAAATDTIYMAPESVAGSIAAIMMHVDATQMDEKMGIQYYIIRSKELKALGNPHESMTPEILSKMEASLAEIDNIFNNDVVQKRPLSVQDIIDMKGATFSASQAVELKLADRIVPSLSEAIQDFMKPVRKGKKMTQITEIEDTTLIVAEQKVKTMEAIQAERARCLKIIEQMNTLNLSVAVAAKHIEKGYDVDASLDIMTSIAEGISQKTAIQTESLQETISSDTNKVSLLELVKSARAR